MFFEAVLGPDQNGDPLPLDPGKVLRSLNALPFDEDGRYHKMHDGDMLCAWALPRAKPPRMVFGRTRRSNLPVVEQSGTVRRLGIPQDAGLVERIHVVFFEDNIVGADYNHFGPRASRLASYLIDKTNVHEGMSLEPLLLGDAAARLQSMGSVTLLRMKVRSSHCEAIRKANKSFGDSLIAQRELSNAAVLEIELRSRPHKRDSKLNGTLKSVLRSVLRLPNNEDRLLALTVGGRDKDGDRIDPVDLLASQITAKKSMVAQGERSRAVDSDSAFSAIIAAYDELREDIDGAQRVVM